MSVLITSIISSWIDNGYKFTEQFIVMITASNVLIMEMVLSQENISPLRRCPPTKNKIRRISPHSHPQLFFPFDSLTIRSKGQITNVICTQSPNKAFQHGRSEV